MTQSTKSHSLMAGLDFGRASRALTTADDSFHAPDPSAPHWTETSWWGIASARLGIGGWIYLRARPNLGTIACGIYVFDAERQEMWDSLYHADYPQTALPKGADLTRLELDNGLGVVCDEPFRRYRMTYRDGDFSFDLAFTHVADPWPVGVGEATGHIDQAMWVTGTIAAGDERFVLDDPAFRDRTWSGRSDNAPCPLNYYTWGTTADRARAFYAAQGGIIAGRRRLDGSEVTIVDIRRDVLARHPSGRPQRISLHLKCDDGTRLEADGRVLLSYPVMALPRTLAWSSVVEWTIDGQKFVGEDHEGWSLDKLRSNRRATSNPWAQHIEPTNA